MNAAIFFERNGILNSVRVEKQQQINPLTFAEFLINSEAVGPLQKLKAAGFILIATTNQPGLSLGFQPRRELDRMHALLKRDLGLDDVYTCPHSESDECRCRKPEPGLLFEAAHRWRLDLDHSFVVSDKWQDALAAHNVGCTSLLLRSPWSKAGHHDFVLPSLADIASKIVQLQFGRIYPSARRDPDAIPWVPNPAGSLQQTW